jgi:hypothetical protein
LQSEVAKLGWLLQGFDHKVVVANQFARLNMQQLKESYFYVLQYVLRYGYEGPCHYMYYCMVTFAST